jgi:hypothetical protein
MGKTLGKQPLGRLRKGREDIIKIVLREVDFQDGS